MTKTNTNLDLELKTFNEKLMDFIPSKIGKFVLIKGTEVHGVYDTYADALKIGYEVFKLEPFLVKQVAPSEKLHFFSRELALECRP